MINKPAILRRRLRLSRLQVPDLSEGVASLLLRPNNERHALATDSVGLGERASIGIEQSVSQVREALRNDPQVGEAFARFEREGRVEVVAKVEDAIQPSANEKERRIQRALEQLEGDFFKQHKLSTIRQMISRYAPDMENNTVAYMKHVGSALQKDVDERIDFDADSSHYLAMAKVIARHENSLDAMGVSDEEWKEAFKMAGF